MTINYFYTAIGVFTLGIFTSTFFVFSLPTLTWILILSLLCALFWYRDRGEEKTKIWLLLSIILLAFTLGSLRMEVSKWSFGNSVLEADVGEVVTIVGVVAQEPDRRENVVQLYVEVGVDLVLVSSDRYKAVAYGDLIEVKGKLKKPESFVTEFGRTFDYEGYLWVKGVEYQISFAQIEVLESNLGNSFVAGLFNFKRHFMNGLEKNISEPAVGLGEGLLLGVKQALGNELEEAFRKTGLIHIVVLSGYNVMLVVAFVMFVLGYFLSIRWRVIVGILAIISFAFLVGLSATVVRASIMASILLVAQATGRMYFALRGLLVAGLIMLLFNPYLLVYDVGFQLSFLATLGLILIAPILEQYFSKVPSFAGMRLFLVATIATQIAVLPLLLYQIGQFSMIAVVANILVLPMVPIAMLLTFITGMMSFVSANLAWLMSFPTYWSLVYINQSALWLADFSFSAYVVPTFSFYFVPLAYLILGGLVWLGYRSGKVSFGQSEIGESLLKIKEENQVEKIEEHKNNLIQDWVIEEEKDEIKTKGSDASRRTPKEETPIFFR